MLRLGISCDKQKCDCNLYSLKMPDASQSLRFVDSEVLFNAK